jgi:hypothetical protein
MGAQELHVVTGAFGYSGKYIAARLLQAGHRVRTLTNSVDRPNPFGGRVEASPFHFADKAKLVESLRGVAVFYNTYWVRFKIDAIGPETFTYRELVREIGAIIGKPKPIISIPPSLGYGAGWLIGKFTGDVVITREEIEGLMQDLLCTKSPPAGSTRLTNWARAHAVTLGQHYASELARRRNRQVAYTKPAGT